MKLPSLRSWGSNAKQISLLSLKDSQHHCNCKTQTSPLLSSQRSIKTTSSQSGSKTAPSHLLPSDSLGSRPSLCDWHLQHTGGKGNHVPGPWPRGAAESNSANPREHGKLPQSRFVLPEHTRGDHPASRESRQLKGGRVCCI